MKSDHRQLLARLLSAMFALLGVVALGGCNTMEGAGRDLESAGEGMQDAAN